MAEGHPHVWNNLSVYGKQEGPCFYCGEETNPFAGNPSVWPMRFPNDPERPGLSVPHHIGCVADRLFLVDAFVAAVVEGKQPDMNRLQPFVTELKAKAARNSSASDMKREGGPV